MSTLADLAAEALGDTDGEEDIEKQIQQALNCPCIGDLKEGPCGQTFVTAFSCYIRSSHAEKGMDCLEQFKEFQECLKRHPDHVDKIMQDAEEDAMNSKHSEATNTAKQPNA